MKDFTFIAMVASTPLMLVVHPSTPANSVKDLIALLKANPGKYSYGSPGVGTVHHLAMELFKKQAGVSIVHVPYKGAAAIIPDVISGQLAIGIISAPPALAQSKAGRLRPIGLTSPVKVAGAPDWPPLADTLPGFDAAPRLFIIAPAGTPAAVISTLNGALKTAVNGLGEAFAAQGAAPDYSTPQELGTRIADEVRKWSQVAKDSGAKIE
jgi:tripartite-type tricarboxylate transporter receptor subunit TctC